MDLNSPGSFGTPPPRVPGVLDDGDAIEGEEQGAGVRGLLLGLLPSLLSSSLPPPMLWRRARGGRLLGKKFKEEAERIVMRPGARLSILAWAAYCWRE